MMKHEKMHNEIYEFYNDGAEIGRLERRLGKIEFYRSKEILSRYIDGQNVIYDVGGGIGSMRRGWPSREIRFIFWNWLTRQLPMPGNTLYRLMALPQRRQTRGSSRGKTPRLTWFC